jgi:hypothetical protein
VFHSRLYLSKVLKDKLIEEDIQPYGRARLKKLMDGKSSHPQVNPFVTIYKYPLQ